MRDVKLGTIVEIHPTQNIGFIVEENTGTKWLFFLDVISKRRLASFKVGTSVKFKNDGSYDQQLFVACEIESAFNYLEKAV